MSQQPPGARIIFSIISVIAYVSVGFHSSTTSFASQQERAAGLQPFPRFDAVIDRAELTQIVDLDGHLRVMSMKRVNVFAPGATFVIEGENGPRECSPPRVAIFAGQIEGDPASTAVLSISPAATYGFVSTSAATHVISSGPMSSGLEIQIANLSGLSQGDARFECGVTPEFQIGAPAISRDTLRGAAPCRTAVIALETDFEYTANLFGGNTDAAAAYAATLIGSVSAIYTRDLNVRLQLGYLRLWTTAADPWTGVDTGAQLGEFQSYWNANMGGIYRHLAHFLSGRGLGGGIAWVSVMCNPSYGYAVSAIGGYFPHPIIMNHGANWDLMVAAHELGHNFGAPHTHDMTPQVDNCANGDCSVAPNGTIMSYCHFCPNGLGDVRMELHPRSINEAILPHLAGSCSLTGSPADDTALWFDGANDFGSAGLIGNALPRNEVTVEAWVYSDDNWQRSAFGLNQDSVTNRFQAHVPWQDGRVYWDFGNINTGGRLSYAPPVGIAGAWHHFAFVASQSGNFMRIYRNGVLEAEKVGMRSFLGGNFEFRIGSLGTGNFFRGKLNEFRIWNVARTGPQIAASFNQVLNPVDEPTLQYYWRFEEGAGATSTDLASNQLMNLSGTQWIANDDCINDTGQCLFFDGGCMTTTREACGHFGGSYQGDGSVCDGGPYALPGGCCLPPDRGLCAYLFEVDCAAVGGSFSGEGTTCGGVGPLEGYALEFDGTNDKVRIGNTAALNFSGVITIEAWIRPDAVNGTRNIMVHGLATVPPRETGLRINAGAYEMFSNNGSLHRAAASIPATDIGRWVHLAGTHDGAMWRLYRNGVLAAEASDATGALNASTDWGLGGRPTTNDRNFDGLIDEVRVWNVARSGGEILGGMLTPLSGAEIGLAGYWRVDGGSGTSLVDSSAFGSNGTFVNDPQWRATAACAQPCPGDLDQDGQVGLGDLTILLANFGESAAGAEEGDLDDDQDVDLGDLSSLLARFGNGC